MFRFACFLAAILGLSAPALPSYITFPSDIDWVTRKTDHFEIIYRRGQDAFALRTLRAAEKAHKLIAPIFPKGPDSTYIVLADFQDSTNGYSLDFPWPHFVIFASPPEPTGILKSLDDWLDSVVLHEYVHTLHLYPARGLWSPIRAIFGPLVLPNGLMPSHMHEGIATFLETELTKGGRGRGTQFKAYRRMAVEEGVWGKEFSPIDRFDGTASVWPHGASAYFFGYWLYEDLWRRKGAKGIYQLTESSASNWPYFLEKTNATRPSMKTPFQEVYGRDYPTLWKEIFDRTGEETKREIALIKKTPLSPLKYLTDSRFSKWDFVIAPDGKRAAYRSGNAEVGSQLRIAELSTMKTLWSTQLNGGRIEGLCWGRTGNEDWLVYLETKNKNNYSINHLWAYQPERDETRELVATGIELNHIHGLACLPDLSRLVVYREVAGAGAIYNVKLSLRDPTPRPTLAQSWPLPAGAVVTSLHAGQPTLFAVREGTATVVYKWAEGGTPEKVLDTSMYLSHVRPMGNGDFSAVADLDGRDELWRIDPQGRTAKKIVGLLGGTVGYDVANGQWYVVSYRHGGYDIAVATPVEQGARPLSHKVHRIGPRSVEASTPGEDSAGRMAASVPSPELRVTEARDYSAWGTVLPRLWIPTLLFVPNGFQAGIFVAGFDLAQRHAYSLIGGYDSRGQPFGNLDYAYRFGKSTQLVTSLYFLPSYLITSRVFQKNWGVGIGFSGFLPIPPNITISAVFNRTEASPLNGGTDANQGVGINVTASYNIVAPKARPMDVTPYKGTRVSLSHTHYLKIFGSTHNYFVTSGGVDQYLEAPWARGHVFWLSARIGITQGVPQFFQSYFQGGGEILFNLGRGSWLNRGFVPGMFLAQKIATLTAEYRFPIVNIERGRGTFPLFLKRIHGALVFDAMTVDRRLPTRNKVNLFAYGYASAGVELKTDMVLSYYLPAQVRLGAYHGFGPYGEPFYFTIGFEASL